MPHISLVFREMWDTTVLDVQLYRLSLGAADSLRRVREAITPFTESAQKTLPQGLALETWDPCNCPGVPWRDPKWKRHSRLYHPAPYVIPLCPAPPHGRPGQAGQAGAKRDDKRHGGVSRWRRMVAEGAHRF